MAIEHIEQFGKGEIRNMDKDTILKSELRGFNINIDDVKPNDDIFGALEEAIVKMRSEYLINRLEIVLNDNLIEVKDKITNVRTLFGARVSYDNLPKDISFIVRGDNKPTYEQLEQQVKKQKQAIDKAIELRNDFAQENAMLIFENGELIKFMNNLLDILNEVSG